jgi:hypothetical protein
MQSMLKHLFTHHRRRRTPPDAKIDRRSGAPARRGPDPMPRMRWYS